MNSEPGYITLTEDEVITAVNEWLKKRYKDRKLLGDAATVIPEAKVGKTKRHKRDHSETQFNLVEFKTATAKTI